jgi:hypothetical protein
METTKKGAKRAELEKSLEDLESAIATERNEARRSHGAERDDHHREADRLRRLANGRRRELGLPPLDGRPG